MSIMVCTGCDRYVDTDFDVEGVWEDRGVGFWCAHCLEGAVSNPQDNERIMEALKHQDPTTYAEVMAVKSIAAE